MIDFTNKSVVTESDIESEHLLKKAVAQGFSLPKGEKAMEPCRFFHFVGSPYKQVISPEKIRPSEFEQAVRYSELFGDEREDLRKIADLAARWCRTYGYKHLSVFANEETENGTVQRVDIEIKKPRKITIAELEKHFGYPIEIVS